MSGRPATAPTSFYARSLRICALHDAAIRFLTFATHQFPQSAEAFQNLGEGLEKAGRIEEAYNAIVRAEALAKDNPELLAFIQEGKARLQKLRPAPHSGS